MEGNEIEKKLRGEKGGKERRDIPVFTWCC